MIRPLRFPAFALIAALVMGGGDVIAQPAAPAAEELGPLAGGSWTEGEIDVWLEYQNRRPITARRKAEEILKDNAESIVAQFVLGSILREAEGQLPQAMHHLGRARELYETRWPATQANPAAPWMLHRELLFSIQRTAGELEKHDYRLQILDFHDALYEPDLVAEHAWPLMQLGKHAKARSVAKQAIESAGSMQQSMGRNALCALEAVGGTRKEWFDACLEAYDHAAEHARADPPMAPPDEITPVAVHAYNAALAAAGLLRPDEVERLALAGASRLEFTAANPWSLLVRLYLDQGRGEEAVAAAKEAERWRARQPPSLRDQILADKDATIATLFLMAGRTQPGLDLIDRALARPDRRGLHAISSEVTTASHALLRRALRRTHREVVAERATYESVDPGGLLNDLEARFDEAADAGRVVKVLGQGDRMVDSLRLFVHGGIEPVPVWLVGDLVEVAGAGVVATALDRAREAGETEGLSGLEPYYDAIDSEVRRAWRDHSSALVLAERALDGLPESEVALRARVAAVAFESADELGENDRALGFLSMAAQLDPGVLRRRGLALPTKFESDGGVMAEEVLKRLEDSPRFIDAGHGFRVRVEGQGLEMTACLFAPEGERMGCASPEPERIWVDADGVVDPAWQPSASDLVRAVHHELFAIPLGLSAIDMGSLDGTATVSGEHSRQRLRRMLDDVERE